MRSDPSYPDLAGPQFLMAGGSSHRLGNLRNACYNLLLVAKDIKLRCFCHETRADLYKIAH